MEQKTTKVQQTLLIAIAVICAIIIIFPIYVMLISSFKPLTSVFDLKLYLDPSNFTLGNYIEIFRDHNIAHYLGNSFFIASTVTIFALLFHSMAAYSLARLKFPGKNGIFIGMLGTLMIPFSVIMIPLFIIIRFMGLTNNIWGIIIPLIPNAYGIFLLRQFFMGIPNEMEESAKIDGATLFEIFWKIYLPLSVPILLTLATGFFLTNWNTYLWPLIVANKKELWVVQMAIANFRGEKQVFWNLILSSSCIAAIPTILIFSVFQKYLVEGIKMSGVKA